MNTQKEVYSYITIRYNNNNNCSYENKKIEE